MFTEYFQAMSSICVALELPNRVMKSSKAKMASHFEILTRHRKILSSTSSY